jgi:GTP-binding protein Era
MVRVAREAQGEADIILHIFDAARGWVAGDAEIADQLAKSGVPVVLVANKVDKADDVDAELAKAKAGRAYAAIVAISAQEGQNVDQLVNEIFARLPEGPQYYPDDIVSDQPDRFAVSEIIREKVLELTREEIPHSVAIDVERMAEDEDTGLIRIDASIYVERDSQKGIVIGQGGRMLKEIGTAARMDIETYFGGKTHLALWVKVREHWRAKDRSLREFGYE